MTISFSKANFLTAFNIALICMLSIVYVRQAKKAGEIIL